MKEFVTMLIIGAIIYGAIRMGIFYGTKYIDRMLHVAAPLDPTKPVVRPTPAVTSNERKDAT